MRRMMPGLAVIVLAAVLLSGCATSAGKGAGIGAAGGSLLGAGLGALIGHQSGHTGEGAAIGALSGAALGGGAGYAVGKGMDKNREQDAAINQAVLDANTVTVNIRNSDGSFTPVRLVRQGTTWVGPQGEFYTAIPTEEQLRQRYADRGLR